MKTQIESGNSWNSVNAETDQNRILVINFQIAPSKFDSIKGRTFLHVHFSYFDKHI